MLEKLEVNSVVNPDTEIGCKKELWETFRLLLLGLKLYAVVVKWFEFDGFSKLVLAKTNCDILKTEVLIAVINIIDKMVIFFIYLIMIFLSLIRKPSISIIINLIIYLNNNL